MQVAYLDPGSGSVIATALVGGAAAAGVALKSARSKVGGMFSRNKGKHAATAEPTSEAGDEGPEPSSSANVDA